MLNLGKQKLDSELNVYKIIKSMKKLKILIKHQMKDKDLKF